MRVTERIVLCAFHDLLGDVAELDVVGEEARVR
jgi:hypothetical protein